MTVRRIAVAAATALLTVGLVAGASAPAQADTCNTRPGENQGPYPDRGGDTVSDPVGYPPNWNVQYGSPDDPYVTYFYRDGYIAVDGSGGKVNLKAHIPYYYIIGEIEIDVVVGPDGVERSCVERNQENRNDDLPIP